MISAAWSFLVAVIIFGIWIVIEKYHEIDEHERRLKEMIVERIVAEASGKHWTDDQIRARFYELSKELDEYVR